MMPKSAWSGRWWASRQRSAQRCVRAVASLTSARDEACGGTGWSRQTAMSEPSASWTAMACSGVKRSSDPSRCERKVDAVLVDDAQVAQADDLEAARVGEDGAGPRP